MTYTPRALETFRGNLESFRGEGRLAIHVTMNDHQAVFSVGELILKKRVLPNEPLAPSDFHFVKVASCSPQNYNGIMGKNMIETEIANFGEYAPYFDLIVNDLNPHKRITYLEKLADTPSKLSRDGNGFKFEPITS